MATFSHTVSVETSPAHLWSFVRDVSRVAGLFPYTSVDDMASPEPECWLFWRQLSIPNVVELRWRERAHITAERELHFQAVEGDLSTFHGHWAVASHENAASLTLTLEYEIPDHLRPAMPSALVTYVMGELFKSICQRIKEVTEEETA